MPLVDCGVWMEYVAGAIGRRQSLDGAYGRCHW